MDNKNKKKIPSSRIILGYQRLSAYWLLDSWGINMKENQSLGEIDRNILDIISHYGSLEFIELWYEIGEDDALKKHQMTKEELLMRLEFLETQGFVEHIIISENSTQWVLRMRTLFITDSYGNRWKYERL